MSPILMKALFKTTDKVYELHDHWKIYVLLLHDTQSLRDENYFAEAICLAATARILLGDISQLMKESSLDPDYFLEPKALPPKEPVHE